MATVKNEHEKTKRLIPNIESDCPTKIEIDHLCDSHSLLCPSVSAKSWAITSLNNGEIFFGKNIDDTREIASLTKIMTCYSVLKLTHRWNLDLRDIILNVTNQAASINGTKAGLACGDNLNIWNMLHGMMLPSGNDAAICIAEYFGQLLFRAMNPQIPSANTKSPVKYFITEMNLNVKLLGLHNTKFANPHGLACLHNKSTAKDLGLLCSVAMKIPKFREVVSCKEYTCTAIDKDNNLKEFRWINTNKLLWEGFLGVKTGITPHAGPCLASCYEDGKIGVVVVLLDSRTMDARWNEAHKLTKCPCPLCMSMYGTA